MGYCNAPGCERETTEGRTYCAAHWKRVQRGQGLGEAIPDPLTAYEQALAAWIAHIDAEDDEDYHRTRVRALKASRRWSCTECEEACAARAAGKRVA